MFLIAIYVLVCYRCLYIYNIVTDPLAEDSHEKIARTQHQPHAGASPESMEWKRVAGQGLQVCSKRPSIVLWFWSTIHVHE